MAMCYCLWIPEFMELARPLYINTKGGTEPIIWTEIKQKAFETLKTALTSAPAPSTSRYLKTFSSVCPQNRRHHKRGFKHKLLGHGNVL